MTAATPDSHFVVWTRNLNDEESWKLELSTDDLAEAQALALEFGTDDVISTIYERGRFKVGRRYRTEYILFWWSDSYAEQMGGVPEGRGEGWPEHHKGYVMYEPADDQPAGSSAIATGRSSVVLAAAPQTRRYQMIHCERCGLELPKNEAYPYTQDVKIGSSSGSSRSGYSSTSRTSSRSFSNSSTSRQSYSSGRNYYRRQTMLLCGECYTAQVQADKDAFRSLIRLIVLGGVIALIALISKNYG